jgi:V8-like Glu-specific endopeptidase
VEPGVVVHPVHQDPAQVLAYWTPERMREAAPLDGPQSRTAKRGSVAHVSALAPDQEISPSLDASYPNRVVGRLFFRKGTTNARCTASVVTSLGRNLILTAAHCLSSNSTGVPTLNTNFMFAPAYRDGATPFGTYAASAVSFPPGFVPGATGVPAASEPFDIGAVNLAPGPAGLIQDALGSYGIAFNRPAKTFRGQTFQVIGYPGQPSPAYNGQRPILCTSLFSGIQREGVILLSPCNMQEGASGSSWTQNGFVTAIFSHNGCETGSQLGCNVVGSTYLGNSAFALWATAGGGLPPGTAKRIKRCKRKRKRARQNCIYRAETFAPVVR